MAEQERKDPVVELLQRLARAAARKRVKPAPEPGLLASYLDHTLLRADATPEQWRLMTMRYRANCTWIDDMFGRAIKALQRKGVLNNALIVYCADLGQ